jgi:hypothetical protein
LGRFLPAVIILGGSAMRHQLLSFVSMLAVIAAIPATAAEIRTASQIDSVTVYPDSAMITRVIRLDLPAGDSTLLAQDFPLTLDPSSLRVEGEGGARLVIGAVEARPPLPQPAANLPQIDRRIEALRDERAALDGAIASASARRKFAERFAETSPTGLGEKGEARPIGEWRLAFAAVAEEIAAADNVVRDAKIKQRDIDREIARLEAERNATPPKKMEVRIDLNADAAAPALLRVTYAVRGARWTPTYDARLDTGGKDRKPSLELVRRAEIVQTTGEDWPDRAPALDRPLSGDPFVSCPAEPRTGRGRFDAGPIGRARARRGACKKGRGATGHGGSERLPGDVPDSRPHRRAGGAGRQELPHRVLGHHTRADGARGAGAHRDRVFAGEL